MNRRGRSWARPYGREKFKASADMDDRNKGNRDNEIGWRIEID